MSKAKTAEQVLKASLARAGNVGKGDLAKDARKFVAYVLGVDVTRLDASLATELPKDVIPAIEDGIAALAQGLPLSRLIQRRAFWKEEFHITGDVLDPRPDTETLVEAALDIPFARLLDLGTGSGCILVSLLNERRDATGVGADISPEALSVAQRNVNEAGCGDVAELVQSDWFSNITDRFDVIVSNPPYIDADTYAGLDDNVLQYDPKIALTPGETGLEAYRVIVPGALEHLTSGGWLMVEIGFDQAAPVKELFISAGYDPVEVLKDINGKDRVIRGKAP